MILNLNEMDREESASILSLQKEVLGAEQVNYLLDYGFIPGTEILVLQKIPSHDKLIVKLGRSTIAIRLSDAKYIQVNK
ncbi:MAG: ferrous iron transport protein A [Leptospiraceae bacterium]|nr:ferrous iron transport protein A [Leptospiraceae bacterium]MCP5502007.1 ferrous iron transport protein A [Leptospiraceae bacterium]